LRDEGDEDLGPLFAEVNPEAIMKNTNPTTVCRRIEGGDGDDVLHGRPGNLGGPTFSSTVTYR